MAIQVFSAKQIVNSISIYQPISCFFLSRHASFCNDYSLQLLYDKEYWTLSTDEEETCNRKNMVLQKEAENTVDSSYG